MNKLIIALIFLATNLSCVAQTTIDSLMAKSINNQNPEKWNTELFENDKKWLINSKSKPMHSSAFPVETYEYYVFSKPFNFQINEAHFSGISFGENTGGKENKFIFKHEITLIFYTEESNYQINGDVSSRNFPYLTIQGQLQLESIYDFIGIKNPDNSGYLIVNLKSFDLRFGQTILIFPNKDNSFYYLQSKEKSIEGEKFEKYLTRIKKDKRILDMIKLVIE